MLVCSFLTFDIIIIAQKCHGERLNITANRWISFFNPLHKHHSLDSSQPLKENSLEQRSHDNRVPCAPKNLERKLKCEELSHVCISNCVFSLKLPHNWTVTQRWICPETVNNALVFFCAPQRHTDEQKITIEEQVYGNESQTVLRENKGRFWRLWSHRTSRRHKSRVQDSSAKPRRKCYCSEAAPS